jgi:hypothetical protein
VLRFAFSPLAFFCGSVGISPPIQIVAALTEQLTVNSLLTSKYF